MSKKYLSLERLTEYDALIKAEISSGDDSALSSAKSYTDTEVAKITSGTTVVPEATHAATADSATSATTASSLTTARTITLGGDASGSVSFDGSKNVTLTVTVADDSHNHVISNIDGLQTALDGKAASSHTHDDRYYTETEVDSLLSGKSDTSHNHDDAYDAAGSASSALASAKTYADSAAAAVKDDLLNGAGAAYDTLKELGDLIVDNADAIDALETIAAGKADASHTHAIADVSGLQSALNGKAASSHTHTVSQISDLTATASELNVLDGITATTAELNHMDGVTSNVQTQLDGKAASSHSHTITATATDDDVIVLTGTNGSNKVTFDAKHATSGVTAGTYKSVTVNAYGHVTAGTNPTTLSGYGITDAYTKTAVDSALSGKAASSHTHSDATTSAAGFMTAAMVTKLNGIATGATKVTVDSTMSSTSTNPVQNKVIYSAISDLTSAVSANTSSISSHSTAISNLQTAVAEIEEITSAEITALFA